MGIFHLKQMKGNWECSPLPALFLLVFQVATLELTPFLDCLHGETALQLLTGFLPVHVQTASHPSLSWLPVFDQEITFKRNFKNTVYQERIYLQRRQNKDWGSASQGCKRCRICEASEPHAESSACAAPACRRGALPVSCVLFCSSSLWSLWKCCTWGTPVSITFFS